jgi:hypothetical protein
MTGAQLRQLREDLSEAIGRPLSVNDFAKLCGLPPESGGGTILEWENGYGPIGPVSRRSCHCWQSPPIITRSTRYQRERRRLLPGDDAGRDHSPDRLTSHSPGYRRYDQRPIAGSVLKRKDAQREPCSKHRQRDRYYPWPGIEDPVICFLPRKQPIPALKSSCKSLPPAGPIASALDSVSALAGPPVPVTFP